MTPSHLSLLHRTPHTCPSASAGMTFARALAVLLLLAAGGPVRPVVAQSVTIRKVVMTGESTLIAGTTFVWLSNPVTSADGSLVFGGRIAGSGINTDDWTRNDFAIWLVPIAGAPTIVARTGSTLPGTPGTITGLEYANTVFDGQSVSAFKAARSPSAASSAQRRPSWVDCGQARQPTRCSSVPRGVSLELEARGRQESARSPSRRPEP